jgi:hypothetical protein
MLCAVSLCCAALGGAAFFFFYNSASPINTPQGPSVQVTEIPLIPVTNTPEAAGLSCPTDMAEVMQAAQGDVYSPDTGLTNEPDSFNLVTYSVDGDQISAPQYDSVSSDLKPIQQDTATQQSAWALFTHLIPLEDRWMVGQYLVFTDGENNLLAAVEQTYYDPNLWIVEVDAADLKNQDELVFTLIHEYAHLLTLNPKQVPPDIQIYNAPENQDIYQRQVDACANYFPGEGCSLSDSYINVYYQRFWTSLMSEWQPINDLSYKDDQQAYYDKLYAFYEAHLDQFVDDYATTNPSEDIAETFAYFVFSPKPAGDTIAEQKILYFYDRPELVQLRTDILQSLCEIKSK